MNREGLIHMVSCSDSGINPFYACFVSAKEALRISEGFLDRIHSLYGYVRFFFLDWLGFISFPRAVADQPELCPMVLRARF
jgi:hypothetical protein